MTNKALANRLAKRKEALKSGVVSGPTTNKGSTPTRELKLSSGKIINLSLHSFTGKADIQSNTHIDGANIREQTWLNSESLADILSTIENIQLYPAIGYRSETGSISVIDGSRRRQAAILKDCTYYIEIADQKLNVKEAEEIVAISEKKKKFTDYEWGKFYSAKLNISSMTQKELATQESLSTTTLSRYINAFKVNKLFYDLFLDKNMIDSVSDNQLLIKLNNTVEKDSLDSEEIAIEAQELIETQVDKCESPDEHKKLVFSALDKVIKQYQQNKVGRKNKSVEPISLFLGGKSKEFIRYQDTNPHKSIIVLSRITADKKEEIRQAIHKIMSN